VIGALQSLLVVIKGLPLAYNRDLQEDKPPLFDAFDLVTASLDMARRIVERVEFARDASAERLETGYLDATTLMESLIRRGIAQRTAHQIVGSLVRRAMEVGRPLAELDFEEFRRINAAFDDQVYEVLSAARAVESFVSEGSTAPSHVAKQIARWKSRLAEEASDGG
jgi:argininosuccinate lyase